MTAGDGDGRWWREGVVYQIYPRSFADGNGDGIGDLRGIRERLDYLNDGTPSSLGVDAIWLSPIYPSPMKDFGYDVSDYCAISPEFGTMQDFDELLEESHRRGIRIIVDLVLNHCSDEHPWFVEARASKTSPKRDWFVWHDGVPGRRGQEPPNNWGAAFGGSAWEWDARTEQFYLHSFLKEQPDVNWRNPDLKKAMWDVMRFWLDRGVDGFRLDVINWFLKDAELRDNPQRLRPTRAYDRQIHLYDRNRPDTLELVTELRQVVDSYPNRMTVGEVFTEAPGDPALPADYYVGGEGLHLAFNFAFLYTPWDGDAFAAAVDRWESLLWPNLWPNYTLSNHDQPRALSRYAKSGETSERARVAATMLLTLRGTPFLYYGEEIGMQDGRIPRNKLQDPVGRRYWPFHPGRDRARTPMQWSSAPHGGFSSREPWLPVNPDHSTVNVAAQIEDPRSLLAWYRTLLWLRKREAALRVGSYRRLVQDAGSVYVYVREADGERIVVALNFSAERQTLRLPRGLSYRTLAGTLRNEGGELTGGDHPLMRYEALVLKVT